MEWSFCVCLALAWVKNEWWCEIKLRGMERSGMERNFISHDHTAEKGREQKKRNGTERKLRPTGWCERNVGVAID